MAGFLSLALAVTLAVVLVDHGVTGTCPDSMGTKDPLMRLFIGKAMELSLCLKDHRRMCGKEFECGRNLRGTSCVQLRDRFQSFLDDLKLCLEGPPPPTTTQSSTTTTPTTTTPPSTTTTPTITTPPPTTTPTTPPLTTTPTTAATTTTLTTTTPTPTTTTTTTAAPQGPPRDCKDVYDRGNTGYLVTDIFPDGVKAVSTRCVDGATVFLNRRSPAGDFNKKFVEYENGFGDRNGDYYLGNKVLYSLITYANYKLLVNLTWTDGSSGYALYDSFSVSGPDDWYRLSLGSYSGTAGDALVHQNHQPFAAPDAGHPSSIGYMFTARGHNGGFWWTLDPSASFAKVTGTPSGAYSWSASTAKKLLTSATLSLIRKNA